MYEEKLSEPVNMERPMTGIESALKGLDNNIEKVSSLIKKLEGKISPVLMSDLPKGTDGSTGKNIGSNSALAQNLTSLRNRTEEQIRILSDIIDRIEL